MRIKIKSGELARALIAIAPIPPKKTIQPILTNVLIKAHDDLIELCATDLEVSMTMTVPAEIDEDGQTTVPLALLLCIIKQMSSEIFIIQEKEGDPLLIKAGSKKIQLATMDASVFPEMKSIPASSREINLPELIAGIRKVFHSASHDVSRDEINSVAFIPANNSTLIAATDGARLAFTHYPEVLCEKELIIPRKVIEILLRINYGGICNFTVENGKIFLSAPGFRFNFRLIDGKFPNIKQAIPKVIPNSLDISSNETINAIKFVSVISLDKLSIMKLHFEKNAIIFNSNFPEIGEAEAKLDINNSIDLSNPLTFNPYFLIAAIEGADSDSISLGICGTGKPIVFTAENYTALIMPMRTE